MGHLLEERFAYREQTRPSTAAGLLSADRKGQVWVRLIASDMSKPPVSHTMCVAL
jgi:hypothetical protein